MGRVAILRSWQFSHIYQREKKSQDTSLKIRQVANEKNQATKWEKVSLQKIDLLRDPTSNKVRSLKAMVRMDHQIVQLTVFLNWMTTKEIIDKSKKARFVPVEK